MIPRHVTRPLLEALADTPVVFLSGARQTGKSTLVQALARAEHPARYVTLDDVTALAAAKADPVGFLAGLIGPVVLDEIQHAPELFLPLKAEVDRDRRPGRFLLTGSAQALILPHVATALAGRMEVVNLWPLSQGEIDRRQERFIDSLFEAAPPASAPASSRAEIVRRLVAGGFPEAITRTSPERRSAWFASYISTILRRDVQDLAQIEGLTALPNLVMLLASRSSGLLNAAELSRTLGIASTTLRRYLGLLEATFLVQLLPAWALNHGKRLVRAPKIGVCDSGLAAHLVGATAERLEGNPSLLGPLLESFVVQELRRQVAWSQTRPSLMHFRTHTGAEVDIILEAGDQIVGVEVKSAASVTTDDFRGLKILEQAAPKRFRRGVVLYLGAQTIAFGKNLYASPITALWH
jgi:predicted AAA+ superfamily ATPase